MAKKREKLVKGSSEIWRWKWPTLHLSGFFRILKWLTKDYLGVVRRSSLLVIIALYPSLSNIFGVGVGDNEQSKSPLTVISTPVTIEGEDGLFLITHISTNKRFRVVGQDKFWRINPNCETHVVTNVSGQMRQECQHTDNWVHTDESQWHRYILERNELPEMIRVPYVEGALIEIETVPPPPLTPDEINLKRVIVILLCLIIYGVLNLDFLSTKEKEYEKA